MKYILGIDVGTQSVKAGLVDLSSMKMAKISSSNYPSSALQEPDSIWKATCDAIKELTDFAEGDSIEVIGLSGQMHGTVLYDGSDNIIGPVINWQDERANNPSDRFNGKTTVQHMTGLIAPSVFDDLGIDIMASGFFGATLFHIKEFEPALFKKINKALLPTDFVRRLLTCGGPYETDVTNAFSTGIFNTRLSEWHSECIESLDLPVSILPSVRQPGEISGTIGKTTSDLTGLKTGIPVTVGGGDNQMSMIGSGAFDSGSPLLINIGTSGQVCAVIDEYVKIPGVDTRSFVRDKFALVGAGITGGICYTWLKNMINSDLSSLGSTELENHKVFSLLDELAEDVPHGCDNLVFEPFLRGTRREPTRRGSFSGIGLDNFSLGHRARAVMEGVVRELYDFYNLYEGVNTGSITGAGNGLVKSDIWCRITAETFNMPLNVMNFENAVYGAALVASEGIGYSKIEDGVFEFVKTIEPSRG